MPKQEVDLSIFPREHNLGFSQANPSFAAGKMPNDANPVKRSELTWGDESEPCLSGDVPAELSQAARFLLEPLGGSIH